MNYIEWNGLWVPEELVRVWDMSAMRAANAEGDGNAIPYFLFLHEFFGSPPDEDGDRTIKFHRYFPDGDSEDGGGIDGSSPLRDWIHDGEVTETTLEDLMDTG